MIALVTTRRILSRASEGLRAGHVVHCISIDCDEARHAGPESFHGAVFSTRAEGAPGPPESPPRSCGVGFGNRKMHSVHVCLVLEEPWENGGFPVTAFSVKSRRVGLHQPSSSVVSEQTFHVDDTDIGAQTTDKLAIRRHLVNLVPSVSYAFSSPPSTCLVPESTAQGCDRYEDQRGRVLWSILHA